MLNEAFETENRVNIPQMYQLLLRRRHFDIP
jgi:hypothetical protein